ncbi:MAG: transglutaminase family protein, partial [Burkholderiales bacterium]
IREGCLRVFLPPLTHAEAFLALVAAIEAAAAECAAPVRLEGYGPPTDPRLVGLQITPDPGVIEVNVQPSGSWNELTEVTRTVYDEAQHTGLTAWKYLHDGRHTGTGGGSHLTLGGPTAADSPFLRRPDLLASLITYWQHHPSLSYLFSGQFIGATSQAPRVDEAREDNLHELEIALEQLAAECPAGAESYRPWLVDRLLRNFLIDITGNTHRSEFCIDKLYSPDSPTGRLGLVELRAIEMPPHPHMSLAVALLLRTLVARFWKTRYRERLVRWGTQLHDRWMLPHFVARDIQDVMGDLRRAGFAYQDAWLAPFVELRFPRFGAVTHDGIQIELRHALEPWNVLGEEVGQSGTSRYVDSSVERVQVKVRGMTADRHVVVCNGRMVPLHPTGVHGEFVAGVRFKARNPTSSRHPTIAPHLPLVFDAVDTWSGRSLGGCTYHGTHQGGSAAERRPVDAKEAEARRAARFSVHGHTPATMEVRPEPPDSEFPYTLDLRRRVD